jgi:hypothetical protein
VAHILANDATPLPCSSSSLLYLICKAFYTAQRSHLHLHLHAAPFLAKITTLVMIFYNTH